MEKKKGKPGNSEIAYRETDSEIGYLILKRERGKIIRS